MLLHMGASASDGSGRLKSAKRSQGTKKVENSMGSPVLGWLGARVAYVAGRPHLHLKVKCTG